MKYLDKVSQSRDHAVRGMTPGDSGVRHVILSAFVATHGPFQEAIRRINPSAARSASLHGYLNGSNRQGDFMVTTDDALQGYLNNPSRQPYVKLWTLPKIVKVKRRRADDAWVWDGDHSTLDEMDPTAESLSTFRAAFNWKDQCPAKNYSDYIASANP